MADSKQRWDEIDKIAFDFYLDYIKEINAHEYFSEWWFVSHTEDFQEFYKKAKIQLRNNKIKKLLNGTKNIST